MNRIWFLFLLLGIFNFLSPQYSWGKTEVVRIATGEYAPYVSKNLKHYGVNSHIIKDSFKIMGLNVSFTFFPWKRNYEYAKQGKYDATSHWFHSKKREQHFYYSDSINIEKFVFFHLKSFHFNWNKLEDIKGLKIGATLEYTYTEEFLKLAKNKTLLVDFSPKDLTNIKKLAVGRLDLFPVDPLVGYYLLQKNYPQETVNLFTFHPKPLRSSSVHLIFPRVNKKKSKRLLKIFNAGLKKISRSNNLDKYIQNMMQGKYNIK